MDPKTTSSFDIGLGKRGKAAVWEEQGESWESSAGMDELDPTPKFALD